MSRRARCSTGSRREASCSRLRVKFPAGRPGRWVNTRQQPPSLFRTFTPWPTERIVSVVEHGAKHTTDNETAPGFHPHLPGAGHRWLGKLIGASMWFFMFYRIRCVLYQDSSS
ncbi:uncharacterized protein SCHCODRAFT_02670553 [Schizophyllum commune H4-8]|uniref:Uncharacterized protein n=1 Tax=Schizophyllum commune (strain H4-8 / FGSC 9210) TaxID=578458 RepID=D8QCG4_SCHCM|nr:uncharacterized protein SCHCODRAFT_02670553 [Schizophyllum commune H4-8]KAI5889575.1 hypothetical protein SCHCODRAFT_02670553 [Schizophyllum commune H4-8]